MATVEKNRSTHTEAAEIMPFGGWERTRSTGTFGGRETLFRFPGADDPSPSPARLLGMALYAATLGLAGAGVGLRALITMLGGAPFWYVPTLSLFGLVSVAMIVGAFLSIHRPALPWALLLAATVPLALDILVAALF